MNKKNSKTKKQHPEIFISSTPKVYKNTQLNSARFAGFTLNDYQVFLHLISKVGGADKFGKYLQPKELIREHTLTAKEFSEVFNTNINNTYKILQNTSKKLIKTSVITKQAESGLVCEMNICSKAEYDEKKGRIKIKFTDDIMPYLSQMNQRFVLYNVKEISNFRSLYTTRLYELIQEFKDTGYMVKSVEQLRNIFGVGSKLKTYKDFKTRTFDHACKEINDNYKINLSYEEIKEGRKVVAIKFKFKKTKILKIVNKETGRKNNIYIKPEPIEKSAKTSEKKDNSSIKNILPKVLKKLGF